MNCTGPAASLLGTTRLYLTQMIQGATLTILVMAPPMIGAPGCNNCTTSASTFSKASASFVSSSVTTRVLCCPYRRSRAGPFARMADSFAAASVRSGFIFPTDGCVVSLNLRNGGKPKRDGMNRKSVKFSQTSRMPKNEKGEEFLLLSSAAPPPS